MERENVGVTASLSLRLPGALAAPGNFCRMVSPSRTWARYSLPSVVSEKSARPNNWVPMICSSCLTRWLTALGVTHSSSAVCVTLRRRARASKVSRHWMGGMRMVSYRAPTLATACAALPPRGPCLAGRPGARQAQ